MLDICCAVTVWGALSACTAAVQSYGALLAIRIILGAVEAVFFPGIFSQPHFCLKVLKNKIRRCLLLVCLVHKVRAR